MRGALTRAALVSATGLTLALVSPASSGASASSIDTIDPVSVTLGGGRILFAASGELYTQDVDVRTARGPVALTPVRALPRAVSAVSVSGVYVLTVDEDGAIQVRDNGGKPLSLNPAREGLRRIKQSGRFSLAGGAIHWLDGTRHQIFETGTDDTDLFGPRIAWTDRRGRVWTRRADYPAWKPTSVASRGAAGPVAIWGQRIAWLGDDARIRVRNLDSGRLRTIGTGSRTTDLGLTENVLSWVADDGRLRVLNLAARDSRPLKPVLPAPYAVDSGLVAGADGASGVHVRALPFLRARPLVLADGADTGLVPGRIWHASFDLTKPVKDVELRIAGRVIRPARSRGTIRGLRWDGTTRTGKTVRPGCYPWRLTARAVDGSGPLMDTHSGPVEGFVYVGKDATPGSGCGAAS